MRLGGLLKKGWISLDLKWSLGMAQMVLFSEMLAAVLREAYFHLLSGIYGYDSSSELLTIRMFHSLVY